MENGPATSPPRYMAPRRKPVPSNNVGSSQADPTPAQPTTDHERLHEIPAYQTHQAPSGLHNAIPPPSSPGQYQHQYHEQTPYGAGHRSQPRQYPPQAQWNPNTYGPQPSQEPPKVGQTLRTLGSFMKGALKATLDPNNIYGSHPGGQANAFPQPQPVYPQPQARQATQPFVNNAASPGGQVFTSSTIVNGIALDAAANSRLQMCGVVPMPGRYWYDNRSGVWGLEGGPCIGLLPPNLSLGGPLAPDASGPSMTGIFINGRQIHAQDAAQLRAMGITCIPGRWWVNADGTYGLEGVPIPWGNLRMQAMASARKTHSGSGYGSWSNGDSFGGSDGQGFNYVGGHDSTGRMWSVSTDGSGYFSS